MYFFLPWVYCLLLRGNTSFNRDKIQKGIGNILTNIKKNRSNIRSNNIYSHLITSSLTVGFGGSAGLEAPIVCTGAAIGSNVGKLFNLSPYEKTVLIASGASAGIAAVFNSPYSGGAFFTGDSYRRNNNPNLHPIVNSFGNGCSCCKSALLSPIVSFSY